MFHPYHIDLLQSSEDGDIDQQAFFTQMTALRNPKRAKTRGLVLAEDSPELNRTAKLAQVFTEIHVALLSLEQDGAQLVSYFVNPILPEWLIYYMVVIT